MFRGVQRFTARAAPTTTPMTMMMAAPSALRHYCIGTPNAPVKDYTQEQMWSLWNEGNLFSLTIQELSQFLEKSRHRVDPKMKKAALVRQVEEILQQRESQQNKQKQQQQGGGGGDGKKDYGQWSEQGSNPDVLLDLSQSGFYEGSTQGAPRAFQLLIGAACPDLTIARVATTALPGFPANAECFTLTGAEAAASTQVRYTKTLQWCCMNLRNLGLDGEVCVEFGKLVLKPDVVRKNRKVLSSWTLQQRCQATNPHVWVSTFGQEASKPVIEVLKKNGFGDASQRSTINEVTIRRANDTLLVDLNAKCATLNVNKKHDQLQQAYVIRDDGPDIRLLVRTRTMLKRMDHDLFTKTQILSLKDDEVTSVLPAEHGEVTYAAECDIRKWERKVGDMSMIVTEVARQPLIISRDEDDGERLEYNLTIKIPSDKDLDLASLGADVLKLSEEIAAAATPAFTKEYALKAETVQQ